MSPAIDTDELGGNVPALLPLQNHVQHYAWGDRQFIPSLLGIDNPRSEPYAELWMGAASRPAVRRQTGAVNRSRWIG